MNGARRRLLGVLLAAALLPAAIASAAGATIRPFHPGSYKEVLAAHEGEPFLLVLWSVTCAPCREEFALLAELRKSHPGMALVLVSTDDVADSAMAGEILAHYGLEHEESWIFADPNAARLRYEIDPAWYGEMPRSYFYDGAHARRAVSGKLQRAEVEDWLEKR